MSAYSCDKPFTVPAEVRKSPNKSTWMVVGSGELFLCKYHVRVDASNANAHVVGRWEVRDKRHRQLILFVIPTKPLAPHDPLVVSSNYIHIEEGLVLVKGFMNPRDGAIFEMEGLFFQ